MSLSNKQHISFIIYLSNKKKKINDKWVATWGEKNMCEFADR